MNSKEITLKRGILLVIANVWLAAWWLHDGVSGRWFGFMFWAVLILGFIVKEKK